MRVEHHARLSIRAVPEPEKLSTRATAGMLPATVNDDERSIEFIAATERPTRVPDYDRMEMVDEVLLMSGISLPDNRQVPFLDSHDRVSVDCVLGSMRAFRVENNQLVGRAFFSKKQKAFDAFRDVKEGHITDVSVGYKVIESTWIPEGQRQRVGDTEYAGPLKVATRWSLGEVSLCPIGADPGAKARGEPKNTKQEVTPMKLFHEWLIRNGFNPETLSDQQKAVLRKQYDEETARAASPAPAKPPEPEKPPVTPVPALLADPDAARKAVEAERTRCAEIRALCQQAQVSPEIEFELTRSGATVEAAREKVLKHVLETRKTEPLAGIVEMGQEEGEKFRAAIVDGILVRNNFRVEKPAPGHEDFTRMSLLRTAEEFLRRQGVKTRTMSAMEIAGAVLGFRTRGAYQIAGTTADFPLILLDAAHKSMQKAYQEAPRQWSRFCSVATAADFKPLNRPQMSEAADLDALNEAGEYAEMKFNERSENYSVATYGRRFTITRKAIINDDQRAFDRIPRAFGAAAQRRIEQLVFSILTTNGNMSDGAALFVAGHSNLASGAAFSATEVGTLMKLIRLQKGFGEDTAPLDIQMKYLIVPVALQFVAEIAAASAVYPIVQYPAGTVNPVKNANIEVISSPMLDPNSAVAFYGAADPNAFDTIEVAFLDGNQSPVIEMLDQMDVDGRIFHVRLDVGAKALDWRGLAKHAGA